jgi:hypothetical protein
MGYKRQHNKGMVVSHLVLIVLLYYTKVLFSVGRGSTLDMYLSHSGLGTYSPVLSLTRIDFFHHSYTLSLVECKTQGSVISGRTPLHFSPSLPPNKPFMLALVCVNTFGPTDHLRWVCIGYLHIWSYLVHVWKPPHWTKGKVLRKTLQVLAHSGKGPHLEGVPIGTALL